MFLISACREEKKIVGDLLWCLVILLRCLVIYYSEVMIVGCSKVSVFMLCLRDLCMDR